MVSVRPDLEATHLTDEGGVARTDAPSSKGRTLAGGRAFARLEARVEESRFMRLLTVRRSETVRPPPAAAARRENERGLRPATAQSPRPGKLPSGGGANEAGVDSKGLKRTARNISFAFNMIRAFGANELRGVKPFVM